MSQKNFFATVVLLILPLTALITGCSTVSNVSSKTEDYILKAHVKRVGKTHYAMTDPNVVTILKKQPKHSKKIAIVSVELTNIVGIRRQTGTVHDLMRKYAALAGGDAITNLHRKNSTDVADVIKCLRIPKRVDDLLK